MSTTHAAATSPPPTPPAPLLPITWKEIATLPEPAAGEKLAYGKAPQQFGELRMPAGKGPDPKRFPVAVLIHGGCWLSAYDYRYFNHLAAALTAQGVATWTIEYRRLGDVEENKQDALYEANEVDVPDCERFEGQPDRNARHREPAPQLTEDHNAPAVPAVD